MAGDRLTICAVGAGRMGRGIATAFALAGHRAVLVDLRERDAAASDALRAEALGQVAADVDFLAQQGLIDEGAAVAAVARVAFAHRSEAAAALAAGGLIFEGVAETVGAKAEAFATIGRHAAADAIIASTSSTIDADTLSALVVGPHRFLNAHWLNPAHLMPLVEVSPADATDPAVTARLKAILTDIGKVPIVCRASPGYIVPRIQALAMNEAARLVEEGVASAEDIDRAVSVGFGLRFAVLGLLEFVDWGGGDTLHHASAFLAERLDPARFAAPAVVSDNMRQGRRGLADGRGFHDYAGIDREAYRRERLADFVALLRLKGLMPRIASG